MPRSSRLPLTDELADQRLIGLFAVGLVCCCTQLRSGGPPAGKQNNGCPFLTCAFCKLPAAWLMEDTKGLGRTRTCVKTSDSTVQHEGLRLTEGLSLNLERGLVNRVLKSKKVALGLYPVHRRIERAATAVKNAANGNLSSLPEAQLVSPGSLAQYVGTPVSTKSSWLCGLTKVPRRRPDLLTRWMQPRSRQLRSNE